MLCTCMAWTLKLLDYYDYMKKFKFPFIIAVSGLNKEEVFGNIQDRLQNTVETEFDTALKEIHKIAEIRLKNQQ